ncbi:uncharacterized protein [Rutidosis leptorrhynchoides]|uniref:uncharacterized protein n=1 Tax=Rutidosis leptorrhynchoides TaxID=125765 RepID=UPI003A98E8DC
MSKNLFKFFDIWDSDEEDELDLLHAMTEELDADEAAEAEEAANSERILYQSIFDFFIQRNDALGRPGFTTTQKNCPVAWKGQYTSGHQGHPTNVLEAVASYDTWIWRAFFGVAGAKNNVNVLDQSSLFDEIKNGTAPYAPFSVNGNDYSNGYYLADGIYPDWTTLIKAYSTPTDEPRAKFKQFQESARKDVERTFGVLQVRFHILQVAGRPHSVNKLRRILYCCVLLHNMIVEDNGYNITWLEEESLKSDEANLNYVKNPSTSREARELEIRDRDIHNQLRQDLTEHIWRLPPNFRSLNA